MEKFIRKKIVKNTVTIIIILLFSIVIINNIDDFETLYYTIGRSNIGFLIITTVLGVLNFFLFREIILASYRVISEKKAFPKLFYKSIIYHFLNISNPLGTAGGTAYLISYFIGRGLSHIRAIFGMFIVHLSNNIGFLIILSVALYNLNESDTLGAYQLLASLAIFLVILLIIFAILFYTLLPKFSEEIASSMIKGMNRLTLHILKREMIPIKSLYEYRDEARELSSKFWISLSKFLYTLPISLLFHIVNMVILFLSFQMFDVSITVAKMITLYGVITLFTIVSPTPQGVGIVEGLAHSVAVSVGISGSVSILAILAYRLAVVWLPALVGLLLFKYPHRKERSVNEL